MSLLHTSLKKSVVNEQYMSKAGELGPIFIVDDNEDDRFFLGHEIKALFGQAPVQVFKDGMRLLDCLYELRQRDRFHSKKDMPRLILMDLYMPGIDGLSALKALRRDLEILDIPIVILSGTKDIREIEKVYEHGATAFLPKPFSRQDFMQAVHRCSGLAHIN